MTDGPKSNAEAVIPVPVPKGAALVFPYQARIAGVFASVDALVAEVSDMEGRAAEAALAAAERNDLDDTTFGEKIEELLGAMARAEAADILTRFLERLLVSYEQSADVDAAGGPKKLFAEDLKDARAFKFKKDPRVEGDRGRRLNSEKSGGEERVFEHSESDVKRRN